jgi:DNA-binding response OmpR family regulator
MGSPSRKTVLIAEDTAAIRTIIAFLLRARGYEVLESPDGNDALEKALAYRPDLVILDVLMPGKQGFEVCTYLKSNEETRSIPIMILTSITRESGKSDDHWRRLSNADDFVSKPFKAHDLLARIERLLELGSDTSRFEKHQGMGGAAPAV